MGVRTCVHAHANELRLHVAFLCPFSPRSCSETTLTAVAPSVSWPLGNCLVMNSAPADAATQTGEREKEKKNTLKCSNQKMRDSEMDELSADVQLFLNVCACV